ncbi:VOC family protein [Kitasatospora cineracea]|uniref:VOC family protein n=1 Tax=Kitasatospora cineracea TaxID=88074 RepID=UPI0033E4B526
MDLAVQLTIDCSDPQRMVAFRAGALGHLPEPPPDRAWRAHWAALGVPRVGAAARRRERPGVDRRPGGPRIRFQQVPEPKAGKNRWHFDLKVGGGRDVPADVRARRGRTASSTWRRGTPITAGRPRTRSRDWVR